MASFDSYFEEKPTPAEKPKMVSGQDFNQYFADEENPPTSGLNDQTPKMQAQAGGAVRSFVQTMLPMGAGMYANTALRTAPLIARYAGDAAAGIGAEGVLQALGVSEKSPGMLALSGAAGPLGRLIGTGVTGIPKLIPGYTTAAKAGLTEHVRDLPGKVIPGGDPDQMYALVKGNMQALLPQWPELGQTIAQHLTKGDNISWPALQKMAKGTGLEDLLVNIEQSLGGVPAQVIKQPVTGKGQAFGRPTGLPPQSMTIPAQPAGMTFENAQANIEALNKAIRNSKSDAGLNGALKDIKRSMLTDLENMPVPPGVPLQEWRAASAAYRDEKTRGLLGDVIEKNVANKEGIEIVNPDGILKALRVNKELQGRLTPQQMKEMEQTLTDWAEASGGVKSKLGAMLAGMTIGGGAGGALVGWAASEAVAKALMTESARKMIGNVIANPSVGNIKRISSILSSTLRGFMDAPGTTPFPFEGQVMPKEERTEPKAKVQKVSAPVPEIPALTQEDIQAKVTRIAKEEKLDPKILHAFAKVESNYNPQALSPKGAVGPMQLMAPTAKDYGVDRFNLDENIRGGARHIKRLIGKYGMDNAKAFAAYNAGEGRVDKGGKLPPETQDYVGKILLELGKDAQKRG